MRDLIKRARPDRFEDVIALVALYRPGPMDLIPEYIERKHGKRVDYLDPRLEPILAPTYGIKIGRASCRERVSIWVVAVVLKKKNSSRAMMGCLAGRGAVRAIRAS